MELTFNSLLLKLDQYKIEMIENSRGESSYKEVRFFCEGETLLEENMLYVGKSSMIKENSYSLKEVGLLLIKDSPIDLSCLPADIALFSGETDMHRLFNDVLNIFRVKRKLVESSASLLNSLIKGKDLNYIVQVGSEILGNPVVLIDSCCRLLASSSNTNVDDIFWNELSSLGYVNDKNFAPYLREGFVDQIRQNQLPVLMDPDLPHNLKRIVGKIELKNKIIAYIAILESNVKLKEEDVTIAGLLCDVIASEMKQNKLYDKFTGVMEYLLIDLLNDRSKNDARIKERVGALFHAPNKNLFVTVVRLPENNINSHLLGHWRWSLESLMPSCKSVYYNDYIVLLINMKSKDQWQEVKAKLMDILRKNGLSAGTSRIFDDITDIRKHYLQGESASRLSQLLKIENFIFEYDDFYIYDLLLNVKSDIRIQEFCHPSLEKIGDYDKGNGTDYYSTLYQYLLCGGNITRTANALFLHRNTVVHQIAKIQEIAGMDLSNGNNRFRLLLAYHIMKLPL